MTQQSDLMRNPHRDSDAPAADRANAVHDLVEGGRAAYRAGKAADAAAAFREVIGLEPDNAQALYYLGLLAYANKNNDEAVRHLLRAHDSDARLVEAPYYLARIAEEQRTPDEARNWYEAALLIEPNHGPSRQRLDALTAAPRADSVTGEPLSRNGQEAQPSQYGIYDVLLESQDPVVRMPLRFMDGLRRDSRPRISAYASRLLEVSVAAVLVAYVVTQFWQTARYSSGNAAEPTVGATPLVISVGVCIVTAIVWMIVLIRTTRYTVDKGRLQVLKGIILRKTANLELYRVVDVTIQRNLLQRATGDGTLVLQKSDGKHVRLVGFANGDELTVTFQQILNLVFALRTNPYVRGIIS